MWGWGGEKTNGEGEDSRMQGKKVEKSGSKSEDGEEVMVVMCEWVSVGGGYKWFNYKPNTISLLLTRDFMVQPDVWQKQLSATNAGALLGARSDGPF